jgi:hypothetical protein
VGGVAGGEYGVIFQETAMRRMVHAPGSPAIFNIERIFEDKGLMGPYSLIRVADKIVLSEPAGLPGHDRHGRARRDRQGALRPHVLRRL